MIKMTLTGLNILPTSSYTYKKFPFSITICDPLNYFAHSKEILSSNSLSVLYWPILSSSTWLVYSKEQFSLYPKRIPQQK